MASQSALTWREDTFAYAQAFDEEAGRYRGLVAGRHADVVVDGTAMLVKPEAAAPQLEAEVPEADTARAGAAGDGADAGDGAGTAGGEGAALTHFYGRVGLDPVRFLRQMSTISDELVAHLGKPARSYGSRSSWRPSPPKASLKTFSGRSRRTRQP